MLEFDEFMRIEGCTEEQTHTHVKQPKTTFAKSAAAAGNGDGATEAEVDGNDNGTKQDLTGKSDGDDVQTATAASTVTPLSSTRLAAIQQQNEQRVKKVEPERPKEEEDPAWADDEGKIATGTVCKRQGCKQTFEGGKRDRSQEACKHHCGTAIFHEGSKGYSCCKRRVLEFDEFLTIEPCTQARSGHLFVGGAGAVANGRRKAAPLDADSAVQDEEEAECRIDHYETPNDVRVTVYAKGVEMDRSRIELQDDQVIFSLALPPLPAAPNVLRRFNRTLLPFSAIDSKASTFNVTRFKVDLVLVKQRRGESWPALERGDKALGYGLTFGRRLDA